MAVCGLFDFLVDSIVQCLIRKTEYKTQGAHWIEPLFDVFGKLLQCTIVLGNTEQPNPDGRGYSVFPLDLHHLEIVFTHLAFWAKPAFGHILPTRTCGNAFFGRAHFFILYPTTGDTHPCFKFVHIVLLNLVKISNAIA